MLVLFNVRSFIIEGNELVLVDTGFNDSSAKNIIKTLETINKSLTDVSLCILTHSHRDHVGSLKALKEKGDFLVAAHEAEASSIEEATGIEVDLPLVDGQEIAGLSVLYLPGHTLGNISLLAGESLIAGDTLFGGENGLKFPNRFFSQNLDMVKASILHLDNFNFDRILVSHGKNIESGGKQALNKLIDSHLTDTK